LADTDPAVSYAVRDLIAELRNDLRGDIAALRAEIAAQRQHLEDRFDRIDAKLDGKADRAAVDALAVRVTTLEEDRRVREERDRVEREHHQAGVDWHRWIWPTLAAIAVVIVGILQIVLK